MHVTTVRFPALSSTRNLSQVTAVQGFWKTKPFARDATRYHSMAMVSSIPFRRGKRRTLNYSAISYDIISPFLRNSLLQLKRLLSLYVSCNRRYKEYERNRDPEDKLRFLRISSPGFRVASSTCRNTRWNGKRSRRVARANSASSMDSGKGSAIHARPSYRDGNRKRYCHGPFGRSLARSPIRRVEDKQEL